MKTETKQTEIEKHYWKCTLCGTYRFEERNPYKCRYNGCRNTKFTKEVY